MLTIRQQIRRDVLEADDYTCFYCKKRLSEGNATLDHVVPKYSGGEFEVDNLVCCCKDCNQLKGHLPLRIFLIVVEELKKESTEKKIPKVY